MTITVFNVIKIKLLSYIIDVFAGVIVGWRASSTMETSLVLDALEKTLWARRPGKGVVHHSDRGSQYVLLAYTQHLKDADVIASVGTTGDGDAYDNALAESVNGLYKAEVIHRHAGNTGSTWNWLRWTG